MFLVTGATGNIGTELVAALIESNSRADDRQGAAGRGAPAPVRALVRDPARAGLPAGAEAVTGDLNRPETMTEALDGVTGMFLLPGYADTPDLLARAKKAGVQRVVLLSGGSAALEDMDNAVSAYMTQAERDVRESGLAWTFLRPRSFMSNALRWLPQLTEGDVVRPQFADVPVATIDPADIAAVAAVALTGGALDGRILELTGPQALLPAEQIAVLAEVLDRPLICEGLTNEQTRAELEATMPPKYVHAFWSFYAEGTLDETTVYPTIREVTGRDPRTFAQWAHTHASAFAVPAP